MIDPRLEGRVAIVTGANNPRGIGAATAQALVAQGVSVFMTYLRMPLEATGVAQAEAEAATVPGKAMYRAGQSAPIDEVLGSIRERGGRADAWQVDLAAPGYIPALFDRVEAAFGPVDILVNNAAHCESDTFVPQHRIPGDARRHTIYEVRTLTAASHDEHFDVNSRAPALMMAELARRHVERRSGWGRIINVSTDGAHAFPGEISYGASKYALESYTRSAAAELGRYGITVNAVSLGPIQTGWIDRDLEQVVAEHTPLGRAGRPDDVADVIVFLASEQARWLTGQLIYVGGGHRM